MGISRCTYESAVHSIMAVAKTGGGGLATACAVHLIMECQADPSLRSKINDFDVVTPDGQPVRWALNLLSDARLSERVYGPDLTLHLCRRAAAEGSRIFLYGSTKHVVHAMADNLGRRFDGLKIVGIQPSRFRDSTPDEDLRDVEMIKRSGADIVLVGLGCPLQERWAYEHRNSISGVQVCVGAAFDFHAGALRQAPRWMQDAGLEWVFRLAIEPARLWRRYLMHNPRYVALVAYQWIRSRFSSHVE